MEIAVIVAREGIPYIVVPFLLAMIALCTGYGLIAILLLAVAAFMAYFFRDPRRTPPIETNIIVAPADGRVTRVCALRPGDARTPTLVSIFLSPLDVHINRAPIAGTITAVNYIKGKFLIATHADSSLVNEQNALTIQGPQITVVCKQIAGVLARRIVCWKHAGEDVQLGERFGLIKFSSRTDVILPPEVEVVVREGMRVKGGATIIGRIL